MDKCPICDGLGKIPIKTKSIDGRTILGQGICYCVRSNVVSNEHSLLQCLGDDYIPFEKIDDNFKIPDNWDTKEMNNYIIIDTESMNFCAHMKSFIMKHRFGENQMKIFCGSSIEVVHKFYVQQTDGKTPHLSALLNYDLVTLAFDNNELNRALQNCIAQVIGMRLWHKLPTWIYLSKPITVCNEYDPKLLDGYLKKFAFIKLKSAWENKKKGAKLSVSQEVAVEGIRGRK